MTTKTNKLREEIERLEMEDQGSKGCTVTLGEWLSSDNVDVLLDFVENKKKKWKQKSCNHKEADHDCPCFTEGFLTAESEEGFNNKEKWKQEALKAMPEEEEEFIEVFDNSTHRYQIPKSKREDWFKWCEIPEDDERAWEAPKYAERIDGMPIKENQGFNRAIQQCKKALRDL